jgi:hypothetical protein
MTCSVAVSLALGRVMLYITVYDRPRRRPLLIAEPRLVKKTFLLDEEEVKRFKARNPSHGALVDFFRKALKRYNDLNDTDPDELIKLAVGELP